MMLAPVNEQFGLSDHEQEEDLLEEAEGDMISDEEIEEQIKQKVPLRWLYAFGLLTAIITELCILGLCYVCALATVGIIATCLWLISFIIVCIKYWDGRTMYTRFVWGLLFASLTGIGSGIGSGYYFQQAWYYDKGNTYNNIQPSTPQKLIPDPTVVSFAQGSFVRQQLTGVYTSDGTTYCVAPILGLDFIPQSKVIFWAVDKNCCKGTYPYVVSNCERWNLTPNIIMKGEIIKDENNGYHTAIELATKWHDFGTVESPYYTSVITDDMHEERQKERKTNGFIIAAVIPPFWFIIGFLAIGINQLRIIATKQKL